MKKIVIALVVILMTFTACTPTQERPLEERQNDNMEREGELDTNLSAIYEPGEVKNCRITAEATDVKEGMGNDFSTIGQLKKDDVVRVLQEAGEWYVVQTDDNKVGAIDANDATPVVKETDVPRVAKTPQPQQQPLQQPMLQQEDAQPQGEPAKRENIQREERQAPAPQQAPVPQQTPTTNRLSSQEQQMVNLVNQERSKNGLEALTVDLEVARVAGIKSQDMADNNYFSHNSPTYGSPFDMLKNFGVSYLHAGENLAGNSTVQKAHNALMNSSGHRQNILNPNFTHVGIGIRPSDQYGYLFTQMFISKPK